MFKSIQTRLKISTYVFDGEIKSDNWASVIRNKVSRTKQEPVTNCIIVPDARTAISDYCFDTIQNGVITYTKFYVGNIDVGTVITNSDRDYKVSIRQ